MAAATALRPFDDGKAAVFKAGGVLRGAAGRGGRTGGVRPVGAGRFPGRVGLHLVEQKGGGLLKLFGGAGRRLGVLLHGRLDGGGVQPGGEIGDLLIQQRVGRGVRLAPGGRRGGGAGGRRGAGGAGFGRRLRAGGLEVQRVGQRRKGVLLIPVGAGRAGGGGRRGLLPVLLKDDGPGGLAVHRGGPRRLGRAHRAAAHRGAGDFGAGLAFLRDEQQRALVPGAEGDGRRAGFEAQGAAAHQVQQMVGDGGVGQVRPDSLGHGAPLVAQHHAGGLPHRGRQVDHRIVGPGHGQRQLGPAGGRLQHVAGEFLQQRRRGHDLAGAGRVGPGLVAEVVGGFAVFQRLQQRPHQPAGHLVGGHQQAAFVQQCGQRGLGQADLAGAVHRVAQPGAEFLGPFFTVFIRHGLGRRRHLNADGEFAVPLQQAQPGAAFGLGGAHGGRHIGGGQAEHAQDAQLACEHHGLHPHRGMVGRFTVRAPAGRVPA